ncbi:MAG: NrfD/PsrC family molybdoenzyme membrane anchor subunit [Candidatus Binatia bacterium]
MDPIVLMQHKWGLSYNIPWYLFLGGLAGGTLLVAVMADLLSGRQQRYEVLSRLSTYITIPIIVVGGLFLTFHLAKPERGLLFPFYMKNYRSWLTLGGFVLGGFVAVTFAYGAAWYFQVRRTLRMVLAGLGVPIGILMALYTGLLLAGAWTIPGGFWFVPLWAKEYIPVLFLLSGVSTGLAACGLTVLIAERMKWAGGEQVQGVGETAKTLSVVDIGAILLEAGWIYVLLSAFAAGTAGQKLAYQFLTHGALWGWFWGGFVAIGLALPILVSVVEIFYGRGAQHQSGWMLYAKFSLVLIGGLVLRYVIVWGGDISQPLAFPPSSWPIPTIPPLAGG